MHCVIYRYSKNTETVFRCTSGAFEGALTVRSTKNPFLRKVSFCRADGTQAFTAEFDPEITLCSGLRRDIRTADGSIFASHTFCGDFSIADSYDDLVIPASGTVFSFKRENGRLAIYANGTPAGSLSKGPLIWEEPLPVEDTLPVERCFLEIPDGTEPDVLLLITAFPVMAFGFIPDDPVTVIPR